MTGVELFCEQRTMEYHETHNLTEKKESTEFTSDCRYSLTPSQCKGRRQPDSPYAYFVCFCGVLCNCIACGCSYSYGLLLPALLEEFREGKAKTAWVGSLAYACTSLFGPVVGLLCDQFSFRKIAFCGGLLSTVALVVTSQASSLKLMFFTYSIAFGFGSSCVFIVVMTIMPRYFIKRLSLATGLAVIGPSGGLLILSPIIQVLLDKASWRTTFLFMAGIMFLTCVLSCSFDPNVNHESPGRIRRRTERSSHASRCPMLNLSYLRNKKFIIHLTGSALMFCGLLTPIVHMAQFCQEQGIGANDASRMYFYNGLASSSFRALTGFVCNWKRVHPQAIMQITMVISGLSIIAPTFLSTYEQLLACFIVYGCADGAITSSMSILALSILTPEQTCQGFGFFHCCLAIAGAAGPPFGGFLADLNGSYKPAFYVAGSFVIFAAGILFLNCCANNNFEASKEAHEISLEKLPVIEKETVV